MNDNRNEPKQLDCTLKCKASARCDESVLDDLLKPDKSLASVLKEKESDETEDDKQTHN